MLSETNRAAIHALILAKKHMKGGLLPILHDIQDLLGYIPELSVPIIAKELNLSRAEVHGVITFYHHFHQHKPGTTQVQICRAEACRAMGSEALWQHACHRIGLSGTQHGDAAAQTSGDISLHAVYCLGMCSISPAIRIGDKVHARIDADKFDSLLGLSATTTKGTP